VDSGTFHKLKRGLKQIEILLVLSRLGAVNLYPFLVLAIPPG
jgi:hypothetical protein